MTKKQRIFLFLLLAIPICIGVYALFSSHHKMHLEIELNTETFEPPRVEN
jgi:hypothetical protein